MNLPAFECYCPNTTAANALKIIVGDLTLWFSYKTPVAYKLGGDPVIVRVNEWGPTTGRHLNAIDGGDKASRVTGQAFEAALREINDDERRLWILKMGVRV